MAIQISKSTGYGVTADYHKDLEIYINNKTQKVKVIYKGYKDSVAYSNSNAPMITTIKEYNFSDFPTAVQSVLASLEGYMDDSRLLLESEWLSGTKV